MRGRVEKIGLIFQARSLVLVQHIKQVSVHKHQTCTIAHRTRRRTLGFTKSPQRLPPRPPGPNDAVRKPPGGVNRLHHSTGLRRTRGLMKNLA